MTRRLVSQRATVAVLKARVDAAIASDDDLGGEIAHAALIRAEMRLWRMEGGLTRESQGFGPTSTGFDLASCAEKCRGIVGPSADFQVVDEGCHG